MEFISRLGKKLADARLDANLITFYGVVVGLVLVSLLVRKLLNRGGNRLKRWAGLFGLHTVGEEAIRHARLLLFWLTLGAVVLTILAGVGYHWSGRDIRKDFFDWYSRLTAEQLVHIGLCIGALVGVAITTRFLTWCARKLRPFLEDHVNNWIKCEDNEAALDRWFRLLEGYAVIALRVLGFWVAAIVVGLSEYANPAFGFLLGIITILAVARMLTLACRALSRPTADLGNHYLNDTRLQIYWERVTRLFPFGERCFEAAVYVSAASMCVRELDFISIVADFGPRIVECIGIVFGTRVLIELLQVLLNQAFGLYNENHVLDQKGQTLIPLLHSVCQYVLYFGSVVIMLGVLGLDTTPIMAGAGILGLAVGLGAQSLVSDVVSGFFILFENQFLVGDFVEVGGASGTVEQVGIRLTQIRDAHGKLHIIPNGQIKNVISFSKGYINAVVDIKMPAGSDLEGVFLAMTDAGKKLRQNHKEVLADTVIQGLVELGTSDMTVRAVTKVRPGAHLKMQNEYRRLLKQFLDQSTQKSAKAA